MKGTHGIILAGVTLLLNAGVTYALLLSQGSGAGLEHLRGVGARLQGAGLKGEAAELYLDYINQGGGGDAQARANIALSAGRLFLEDGRNPEALTAFYTVEVIAPGSPAAKQASKDIVAALERNGNSAAARTAMASRTQLKPGAKAEADPSDPVVAKAGSLTLNRSDAQALRSMLPGAASMDDEAFLTQALARAALLQKAEAASLEEDPEVATRIRMTSEEILISALAARRGGAPAQPSEEDLRAFFDQNAAAFEGQDFEAAKPAIMATMAMEAQGKVYQELVEEGLKGLKIDLYPERLTERKGGEKP